MRMPVLAGLPGVQVQAVPVAYPAPAGDRALGNPLPPNTGVWIPLGQVPAPQPPGDFNSPVAGIPAGFSPAFGTDPRAPIITRPVFLPGQDPAGMDSGTQNNPGPYRGGLQGFNDQLRVVDRHAFWDTGNQKTGTEFNAAGAAPNAYNDPIQQPPIPNLRTVNRTVSHQIGSDNTANQDDLLRPYSRNAQGMYVGEQGSGWSPVYGGVPGMWQPYGSRGGVPYPIQSPVAYGAPGDGPQKVWAGPPHGLHSLTYPDRADTLARYTANPQMRPVRFDRPSNSPQAGQSYSQTVQMQGQGRSYGGTSRPRTAASVGRFQGRGWKGTAG